MKKYYISTAIAYASAKPHIGNTYEIVLADAIARYKRLTGYEVYFQTGTDEHGQKIEEKAIANNQTPQEYVDDKANEVKRIWDIMNTSYNKFVRTTDPEHKEIIKKIFKKLYDQGDIYKGNYEGLYCTPCESFFTESQLVNGNCPDCGREVHKAHEEAYFLKLGNYSKKLEEYIENHPDFIEPESRKNEILNNFIRPGLQDLCVSRTTFKWGIPVSFDSNHVIYVWIDALSNYITFLGYDPYGPSSLEFKKYWPCDLHMIGKDILRFHAIYWPIILHCLGLEMPKKIFAHPWLLFSNDKMSKSNVNIVCADDLVNKYSVDALRYYMLHEIPFSSDGNFTIELFESAYNAALANTLGNLVNRTIGMINKYNEGIVINANSNEDIDAEFKKSISEYVNLTKTKMDDLRISDAVDATFNIFTRANKYIDETSPWALAKDENSKDRLNTVLYNIIEAIRQGAVLLQAFLPGTAEEIFKQINSTEKTFDSLKTFGAYSSGTHVNEAKVLFQRIDKKHE